MTTELDSLRRAHDLFTGATTRTGLDVPAGAPAAGGRSSSGVMADALGAAAEGRRALLHSARDVDARLAAILAEVYQDHADAHRSTAAVLAAARADAATVPDNPIAARELLRRRAARLRVQHGHVRAARLRARHRRTALRALRYRANGGAQHHSRAASAVRAALSRLGRPYVWGATGPDRFDCSGLVQWAYAQAGVRLDRTTYEQIHQGLAVARADVRPGDLVFPHTGHVQMAIGNGMVVEAPQPGATVQISRMGQAVAIRRPV